jgi:hypothetical protein
MVDKGKSENNMDDLGEPLFQETSMFVAYTLPIRHLGENIHLQCFPMGPPARPGFQVPHRWPQ